jgi:hypothetical protein
VSFLTHMTGGNWLLIVCLSVSMMLPCVFVLSLKFGQRRLGKREKWSRFRECIVACREVMITWPSVSGVIVVFI